MPPKQFPVDPSDIEPLVSRRTVRDERERNLKRMELWVVGLLVFFWVTAALFRLRILP